MILLDEVVEVFALSQGIVNLIFSLDEFSPLQPISWGQSGMYEREKREEAPLSRLFSVISSIILIKLTIPLNKHHNYLPSSEWWYRAGE